ncbi:TIGR03086 family metal-binding protein [Streptomyces griseus]|uniref:TIGR03086 family metal-binding protein n=1 Tax=Streptomyces sp. CMC78 TaxID=3231512 RepID=A0AB33KIG3_9ACTN|nr:TIGR03086 family metal-binding protein [Streptomyces sp. ID01-9D]MDX5578462.1 TIGR03086 family metal-binding protein [Streptomyces sp. ID01-9D]WSV21965.1 TIGR03086 family metal-binding protein [Streptomyces fimicarius]WTC89146.1 TIGR03086 family metal-binding protein [Streptomyces griseus]WTD68227.1 TIGR03086 family metal-binding protein [Streptomyces griseus]
MTQKISELLEVAAARALPVVRGIDESRLGDRTPCAEYDVRALLNHLFLVVVNFQALAAREEVDFGREPEFVTGDWRARFAEETDRLVAAWDAPGAEDGTTGQMGLPARTVGLMVLGDLTVHAWDLARATGTDFEPDRSVLDEVGPGLAAMAPQARAMKMFGEPFPVGEGASAFERLLAVTGRDPEWSPAGTSGAPGTAGG